MIAAQHLSAPNDGAGNPRRLWIIYRTGVDRHLTPANSATSEPLETIILDEGYSGRRILLVDMSMAEYRSFIDLEAVRISPAEYRRLKEPS